MKAIYEASYLSVPNASIYRKIMRYFYKEYEKMHFQLYKKDVFQALKNDPELADYQMEQLDSDLESLVKWKNLISIQDPGKVYTIAEYKNKQYRYAMSENAVQIERMTVQLENLYLQSGNLSTNFFVRLERSLEESDSMKQKESKDINEWWNLIQDDFKRLNQNYQDYLMDFYSSKTEHLMKTIEFIQHKDAFIKYLNEFIQELQFHSKKIEIMLNEKMELIETVLLEKVIKSELDIPSTSSISQNDREARVRENVLGVWSSLKGWFIDQEESECESRKVMRITSDIIGNIIRNAALIVQMQNWGISRKDDYEKFLEMFLECESIDEAHCLAAHAFGIQKIYHFKKESGISRDNINRSVYENAPVVFQIKPRTRTYREKKEKKGFASKSLQKREQREKYIREAEEQQKLAMKYIKNKKLVFSEINEVISEKTRAMLLGWIAKANLSVEKTGQTEYGDSFHLIKKEGTCVLKCEDGNLTMPAYVLEFE